MGDGKLLQFLTSRYARQANFFSNYLFQNTCFCCVSIGKCLTSYIPSTSFYAFIKIFNREMGIITTLIISISTKSYAVEYLGMS